MIGDGGQGLSGGQAQRIAIARALIRRPKVLILDEATSALDTDSAKIIRESIAELTGHDLRTGKEGVTVIIITHSIEMMAIAQRIVVVSNGHIIEEGSYDTLLKRRGEFTRLLSGNEI